MTTPDTDFAQFQDTMNYRRRSTDTETVEVECTTEDCPPLALLELRIDRHRDEINEIKKLMEKSGEEIAEVLEIITTAKSFFKVLGWIGEKIRTILAFVGAVAAVFAYFKFGSK